MVVPEGHVGEDAELGFKRGEQPPIEGCIDQVADQCRVAPQSVGEGIIFQSLFFQVEEKGGG